VLPALSGLFTLAVDGMATRFANSCLNNTNQTIKEKKKKPKNIIIIIIFQKQTKIENWFVISTLFCEPFFEISNFLGKQSVGFYSFVIVNNLDHCVCVCV
jgi:hypothetical protein